MKSIESRILERGYELHQFDHELIEGYTTLMQAGIDIPDNLINPGICTGFFGVYCLFISEDHDSELRATIPYLRPGMSFMHCNQITEALKANNQDLLNKYDEIFSNPSISKHKKISMAKIAEVGAPYEHLFDASISDDEAKSERIKILNEKNPLTDPLQKLNDSVRNREMFGQTN